MISPFIFFANSIDNAVFPDAVGPHITITFGLLIFIVLPVLKKIIS
jgi:hypothetical protein